MVRVLKFGGTSIAKMERVLSIVDEAGPCVLVVSALGKATNYAASASGTLMACLFRPYAKRYGVQEMVDLALDSAERGGKLPSSDYIEDVWSTARRPLRTFCRQPSS